MENQEQRGDGTPGSGRVHQHSAEIEASRPRPGNGSASSRRSLGPVRTSREMTPTDLRPGSGRASSITQDEVPSQMHKSEALPPIGTDRKQDESISEGDTGTQGGTATISGSGKNSPTESIASSARGSHSAKGSAKGKRNYPRIIGNFRRESEQGTDAYDRPGSHGSRRQSVTFSRTESKQVAGGYDVETQTEWSWLEDMKHARRASLSGKGRRSASRSRMLDEHEEEDEADIEEETRDKVGTPKSPSKSAKSTKLESNTLPDTVTTGDNIPMPYTDDTYGIPILEISSSSDSDTSDTETDITESMGEMGLLRDATTLPSIGPPQILQYNRESERQPGEVDEEQSALGPLGAGGGAPTPGMFEGTCEFCNEPIKPFPSLEEQKSRPPEELYCCDEYREFVNFMVTHPLHEKFNADKLIDIAPHPPYGSKQARRAAKERAAQRMRERELMRQQAQMTGLGGMGGGGGGGPSNFYQFARQMKTINYQLSSQKCLEEGWTLRPPSPVEEDDKDNDVFEPQPLLPPWTEPKAQVKRSRDVPIIKSYPDGSKFLIFFPDGTGTVFYPSGNVAISITSTQPGLYSYIVTDDSDEKNPRLLAVFEPDGHATSYYATGLIRVCLDQTGGVELDVHGFRKRRWNWKDQVEHIHAPPLQPITFALSPCLAVRIMAQDQISLTYKSGTRSCRFQVGAHLKLVAPENMQPPEPDEDNFFIQDSKARIESIFNKVSNLLKFPKSPKLDRLPDPIHLSSRMEKIERLRSFHQENTAAKGKDKQNTVTVN